MTMLLEPVIDGLRAEQKRLRAGLVARNTVAGYGYDWRMFETWCSRFHRTALPASPDTVSLYLTDLLQQGKKITTARRRKCAIAYEHRARGLASPIAAEVVELLNGAQRLKAEKPAQKRPITVKQLRQMSAALDRIGSEVAMRNRAVLVVGFASALRRCNLADLNLSDIEFCRKGLILAVDREKQDQQGKGRLIGLVRGRNPNTCPVRVLREWLRLRGDDPGPLFTNLWGKRSGGRLRGEYLCEIVQDAAEGLGLDPCLYGAHSLRAGFVTEAGMNGVPEALIAAQTGHRNMQTLRLYFRRSDLWRNNASASLGL